MLSRDWPLPFGLNGQGAHPGEIRVFDRAGRELDEEHVPDIDGIRGIYWTRYKVYVTRADGDRLFRSSLNLAQ